jgi:glycosyltransferase involved in cell wall biosynthesis
VVEHGIADPGNRYTGEVPRSAVVINEAQRRWRVTGTDLLPRLSCALPADLFGMGAGHVAGNENVRAIDDLPQRHLHQEMARRRVYLHPVRWTSLGLSLIEAMMLGMPVVALATTEVGDAVPGDAGIVSNRLDRLDVAA